MKYKTGDKFKQLVTASVFEITGQFPKSCGLRIDTTEDNYYRISIDGVNLYLAERSMDIFLQKYSGEPFIAQFEIPKEAPKVIIPDAARAASVINFIPKPQEPLEVINDPIEAEPAMGVALNAEEPVSEPIKKRGRPKKI